MFRMCVCMHSCFIKNHLIWILKDGSLIFEVVLSQSLWAKWLVEDKLTKQ
jgi:hypothetical protein